jgi:hypothetical protein
MPVCVKCNRDVCVPCVQKKTAAHPHRSIYVASDGELCRKSYVRRLAVATVALLKELELSRRNFPNWMTDAIFGFDGEILWPHGAPFEVSDTAIDDAFNDDGSFRWISDFLRIADQPMKQAPQQRVLSRLRLIDLAFRIARPDVARHFGR